MLRTHVVDVGLRRDEQRRGVVFVVFGGRRTSVTGSGRAFSRFWWKTYVCDRVWALVFALLVEDVRL
jgi:hypothetical protein